MQFLLFDVSATLLFLAVYLTAGNLWRRRARFAGSAHRRPTRPPSPHEGVRSRG
jgi:hypothetical protein